jgi:hypothetical protein
MVSATCGVPLWIRPPSGKLVSEKGEGLQPPLCYFLQEVG